MKLCQSLLGLGLALSLSFPYQAMADSKVNINSAKASELMVLKGVGEAKANAIVAYRDANGPFETVHDLDHVRGFGEKQLQLVLPYVQVS